MHDSSVSGLILYADAGAFAQQICEPVLGASFEPDGDGFRATVRFSLVGSSAAVHLRTSPGTLTRRGRPCGAVGEHFLALVLRGEGALIVGEQRRPLPPNSVVVIDGDLEFSLTLSVAEAGWCEMDWLQLCGTRPPVLAKAPGFAVMISPLMTEYVVGQARLVQPQEGDIGPCQRDLPVFDYIGAAIRDYLGQAEGSERLSSRDKGLYQRITAFIVQTVKNPALGADLLVREFGISKRKLYSIFFENGASLHETVMAARLDAARREIEAGGQKVSSVILDHGFSNPSTFYRNYKRRFGSVPRSR